MDSSRRCILFSRINKYLFIVSFLLALALLVGPIDTRDRTSQGRCILSPMETSRHSNSEVPGRRGLSIPVPFPVTPAQRERPTARLQPGTPDVAVRVQLQGDGAERPAVVLHGLSHSLHHPVERGLCVRCEGVSLRGVSGEVKQQRWVVADHPVPGARAHPSAVAGSRAVRVEDGSLVVDLPDGSSWSKTRMAEGVGGTGNASVHQRVGGEQNGPGHTGIVRSQEQEQSSDSACSVDAA